MGGKRTFLTIRNRSRNLCTPSPAAYTDPGEGAHMGQSVDRQDFNMSIYHPQELIHSCNVRQEPFHSSYEYLPLMQ